MARPLIAALALPLLCLPELGHAAELIPHHAFYTLSLGHSSGQGDIVEASGGMAIEVSETCEAWLTKQRLRLRLVRDEGDEVVSDNNFTSWETKDGLRYRFNVRNRLNGTVNEEYRGEARLKPNGGGGVAKFSLPARKDVVLPKGALFPSAHVSTVIDAAHNGVRIIDRTVFDGATADGPDEVNILIGRSQPLETLPGLGGKHGQPSWPMRWAFFPIGSK
ncbi:MAG: EipB family protein, partial [Alphaproteobacteria bacterium]